MWHLKCGIKDAEFFIDNDNVKIFSLSLKGCNELKIIQSLSCLFPTVQILCLDKRITLVERMLDVE